MADTLKTLKPAVTMLAGHKPAEGGWMATRNTSRHQRGYGAAWERARRRVLQRDCGLCQPCLRLGRTTAATEVDHIRPKFEGGTDDEANLQSICRECHKAKTAEESARARIGR